ncbi:MAG: L-histidine N(alpha)-methyltransferase [Acidobacteria bacterium]|nr:L-histidine N(alpha)-methyltransferase [Acidobacteriota bacterium]
MSRIEIDVLLTEDRIAEEFLAAIDRRSVPEKLFYWTPLSVAAWLELCRDDQPYRNYSRSYRLVSRHAAEIAGLLGPAAAGGGGPAGEMEVVSLGAGQGDKDLLVLEALRAGGRAVRYRPVDSSQALLELAVARATGAAFTARGLKADFADPGTAEALASPAGSSRLFLLLGNTLGAIDPPEFLRNLGRLLRRGDRLLLDGEIFSPADTMSGYDNPANRRFAFAPLASLGLEESRDGVLEFETRSDARLEGVHLIAKQFRATRPLTVFLAGKRLELRAGETIAMNPSWKYSRAAFLRILREAGGFQTVREYLSGDERFLMVLAAPE